MGLSAEALARALWRDLCGTEAAVERLSFEGRMAGLPSRFRVGELAVASVAVAALAAAELWSARTGRPLPRVVIDRRLACAIFRAERLLTPQGWKLPSLWDPISGDYRAADGWIRLHTNYPHHRAAAIKVLGTKADKPAVTEAVARWRANELETALVAAGGCAAALRPREDWAHHPQGEALAAEPVFAWSGDRAQSMARTSADAPLAGMRVLDLTRVIAGPVATCFLAAYGADVLRIDPPGFPEVAAALPVTTRGKRCAALDLSQAPGHERFEALVASADILVHGYRPDALTRLGYSEERLRVLNPGLVIACHDAYGWSGPWAGRRGFDSLVQMSTGIAHPGSDAKPTPLPAQALDHGTGYLVAAAACRAVISGRATVRLSLARTAKLLVDLGASDEHHDPDDAADILETAATEWGPVKTVRWPARIEGCKEQFRVNPGPVGRHEARWLN